MPRTFVTSLSAALLVPTLLVAQQRPTNPPPSQPRPGQQPAARPAQQPAARPAAPAPAPQRPMMAAAGAREGTWELTAGAGAAAFAQAITGTGTTEIGLGGLLGIGYNVDKSWNISGGVTGGIAKSSATSSTAYYEPFGAITWTPDINQNSSPFIRAYGGPLIRKTPSHTGGAAGVSVGLRNMIGENLALRLEVGAQYAQFGGVTTGTGVGTIGLSYFVGEKRTLTHIAVTPGSATLAALRATTQLSAIAHDQKGRAMGGKSFMWRSSNDRVATVSASGMVTATGDGSATISASAEGVTGNATVMVSRTAATIAVTPATASMNSLGATQQLTAAASDANRNPITGASVSWTSSNPSVATVSMTGLVTSVGNGTAQITASSGTQRGMATVTVAQATASVAVTPATSTLAQAGATQQFMAEARDANGRPVAGKTFTWTGDAPTVATVSPTGLATAVANGSARVTASADGRTGSAALTVALATAATPAGIPNLGQSVVLSRVTFAGTVGARASRLTAAGQTSLDAIATQIQTVVRSTPTAKFEVQSYWDNRGAAAAIQRTTDARAQAVVRYLTSKGVPASALSARGYGSASPMVPNTTVANRNRNRRIELKRTN